MKVFQKLRQKNAVDDRGCPSDVLLHREEPSLGNIAATTLLEPHSYIFGSVSKRRSAQQAMLSGPADDLGSVGTNSRRPSNAGAPSRCSNLMPSVSGSILAPMPLTVEKSSEENELPINGHCHTVEHEGEANESTQVRGASPPSTRFTCPLCKRQLSEPRVLPCLHTFCTACLRDLDGTPESSCGEIALWNGENDGRSTKSVDDTNVSGNSSPPSSCYDAEEKSAEIGWSPLTRRRRAWCRGGRTASAGSANNATRIILCPTCGMEARIPTGGVLMFPLHHVLQRRMLVATFARDAANPAGSVLCDLCSTNIQASNRCSDCLLSLCTFCSEAHQRQRRTAAHEVLSLQEARRRGMSRSLRHHLCPIHPGQEFRFFCDTCSLLACRDCCVTLHRDHRPPCEAVTRVASEYTAAVRDAADRVRPIAERVDAGLERLQLLDQRIQTKATAVQQAVDTHIDGWIAALESHRRTLTLQVRKSRDSKLKAVRSQMIELERRAGEVTTAVRFADELLAEGTEVEVLSSAVSLARRLEWCCSIGVGVRGDSASSSSSSTAGVSIVEHGVTPSMPLITRVSDCLKFLPAEVAERTAEGLPLYGVVTTQTCSASHCRIDTEALTMCRQHKRTEVLLVTKDNDNQTIGHGGAEVAVGMRARDGTRRLLPVHVTDRGDGTYLISFLPDSAGTYVLSVEVQSKPIHGNPFIVYVRPLRPHSGVFHCCTFCSSNASKEATCGCGGKMPGGYRGCGHGHVGHPGRRHWSCCGSVVESSECNRPTSQSVYQYPI